MRLSDERWAHITEEHCEPEGLRQEVMEAIAQPERVLADGAGELLALRETARQMAGCSVPGIQG